ncbi:hypothetical protein KR018_003928 [Drosophila ironensis]|nr:hypothetical protein KR018_003928 [Drosophila ironensis]
MTSADYRNDINAHLDNMRIQLKDQLHMRYLASAISQNLHLFKDKVILVLCCGPGTLALMAAKAGASIVYAVDYSLATGYAQLVVKQNGYEDIIQVMMGRMADLKLPQKVDGIVCNWMGQSLLLDSEILEVLQARDRWLNEDGFILPDVGSLYLLGSQETLLKNDRCNWWLNVYGFPMGVMRKCALAEPRYVKASGDKLITLAHKILRLDLKTATIDDLCIDRKFRLQVQREDRLDCFVLYFDVEFSRSHTRHWFSCNPCLDPIQKSMWLQTVIFVDHPFVMREKLFYTGHFKFAPLKPQCMKNMEMRMQLYESQKNDDKRDRAYCRRVVAKRWLMVECFHTLKDVESCQDEQESELSNF